MLKPKNMIVFGNVIVVVAIVAMLLFAGCTAQPKSEQHVATQVSSETHTGNTQVSPVPVEHASVTSVGHIPVEHAQIRRAPIAKNVIFFLGDGMGVSVVTAARIYSVGEAGNLTMDTLPVAALVKTYSENYMVTDSAAAMSAYMTGVKPESGIISLSADATRVFTTNGSAYSTGEPVPTLLELAVSSGMSTGVITTDKITGATPAACYAHTDNRHKYNKIAAQMVPGNPEYNTRLGNGINVVFGGGREYFLPSTYSGGKRTDNRNLIDEMKSAGYIYVSNTSGFDAIPEGANKVLGLFSMNTMSYELDRDPKEQPSLSQMTAKAIDILSKNKKGYFLMVEGGRIDHALHATNAKRVLVDTVAFNKAIKTALGMVNLSNTIIVVTADHDHTMTINGYPEKGSNILGIVRDDKGAPELDAHGHTYTILSFATGPNRPAHRTNLTDAVTEADNYHQETAIPRHSETHGGSDVELKADGVDSEMFHGTIDNTRVFYILKKALGLKSINESHSSPVMFHSGIKQNSQPVVASP